LAYLKANPAIELNTTTASTINVQFSISSAPLISSITVYIPISAAEFYIVKADILFLLYLANIDTLGVYLNNLRNVLVRPSGTVLVVRRFGYPFIV
jgi:hypothetical protein